MDDTGDPRRPPGRCRRRRDRGSFLWLLRLACSTYAPCWAATGVIGRQVTEPAFAALCRLMPPCAALLLASSFHPTTDTFFRETDCPWQSRVLARLHHH